MIMEWKSRTDAHQMTISSGEEEDDRTGEPSLVAMFHEKVDQRLVGDSGSPESPGWT